jgi:hypothetical protein
VATVIAGVSAIWPRSVGAESASTGSIERAPDRSLSRVLVRQTVVVLILVGLLAGILSTVVDVLILTTGLIVAGPVLTALMSRWVAPAFVPGIPMAFRWVGAMVISLAAAWAILKLAGNRIYESDFVLMLTLAIVAPLFRFLLEAGADRPARTPAPASSGPPMSAVIWGVPAGTLLCSVLFPSAAWAHDCPQELADCLRLSLSSPLGLLAAAMLMSAAAMTWARDALYKSLPIPKSHPDHPTTYGEADDFHPDADERQRRWQERERQRDDEEVQRAEQHRRDHWGDPPAAPDAPPRPPGVHGPPK